MLLQEELYNGDLRENLLYDQRLEGSGTLEFANRNIIMCENGGSADNL